MGSSLAAVTYTSNFAPVSSKKLLDIQATIECGFTLKTRTWHDKNIQSKCTVQKSTHNTAQSFGQFTLKIRTWHDENIQSKFLHFLVKHLRQSVFASSIMKNIVAFSGLSNIAVKLIYWVAIGSASNACCLLKSIAIIL